jgi:hypothetical protein
MIIWCDFEKHVAVFGSVPIYVKNDIFRFLSFTLSEMNCSSSHFPPLCRVTSQSMYGVVVALSTVIETSTASGALSEFPLNPHVPLPRGKCMHFQRAHLPLNCHIKIVLCWDLWICRLTQLSSYCHLKNRIRPIEFMSFHLFTPTVTLMNSLMCDVQDAGMRGFCPTNEIEDHRFQVNRITFVYFFALELFNQGLQLAKCCCRLTSTCTCPWHVDTRKIGDIGCKEV